MNNSIFFSLYGLAHQSIFFDKLIIFVADIFPYIVVIFAIIFLLFHHEVLLSKNPLKELSQKWIEIVSAFFSGVLAWIVAEVLKILLHTPRPFIAFQNVVGLFPETGFAFPSQHSTFFMALAVSIFFINKKIGYIFIIFAIFIGCARIIAGVHFPIDVLAGFILGIIISIILKHIFKKK
jgi:undecaprenyl-diphosphatase